MPKGSPLARLWHPHADREDTPLVRKSHRPSARIGAIAAALVGVALLAACGGPSSSGVASLRSTSTTTTAPSSAGQTSVRYASCMRAHGVLDFPDWAVSLIDGHAEFNLPRGIKREPRFASASRECQSDLPGSSVPAKHVNVQEELAFAICMRSHGITDFPDPLPGGGFNIPGDTNSAQFEAAASECQSTGIHWNSAP